MKIKRLFLVSEHKKGTARTPSGFPKNTTFPSNLFEYLDCHYHGENCFTRLLIKLVSPRGVRLVFGFVL